MCKKFKGLGKVKREIVGFLMEREGRILNWLASVFGGKVLILLGFWVFAWASQWGFSSCRERGRRRGKKYFLGKRS